MKKCRSFLVIIGYTYKLIVVMVFMASFILVCRHIVLDIL